MAISDSEFENPVVDIALVEINKLGRCNIRW
jgi:hypothetical protein